MHGSNVYQKPQTVTFTFRQKRFDKSGDVVDEAGQVVYRLKDTSDDHTFGFSKSYPLEIHHAHGNSRICSIDWHGGAEKTTITGFNGRYNGEKVWPGLMNEDCRFSMQDGSSWEWDGVWGFDFKLFDYQIQQPYSLKPAVAAIYTPRPSKDEYTKLEVRIDALSTPGLLDYLVAMVLYLDWKVHDDIHAEKNAALGNKIGKAAGKAIGKGLVNDFGGGGGA